MLQTISITVSGKVQGVFYRQSTKEKAVELGITGTVKNLKNGNVYIIATGAKEKVEELVAWCKQGPAKSKVMDVKTAELSYQHFEKFSIHR